MTSKILPNCSPFISIQWGSAAHFLTLVTMVLLVKLLCTLL